MKNPNLTKEEEKEEKQSPKQEKVRIFSILFFGFSRIWVGVEPKDVKRIKKSQINFIKFSRIFFYETE